MTTALRVKFDVQDLDRTAATAVIYEAVSGEDWQDGYTFSDGSSMTVSFFAYDSDSVEQCVIHWYDERGERPDPAVRTRFTCSYMENEDFIEAYYDGSILFGRPLPYLTFSDVTKLMRQVSGVRIVGTQAQHSRSLIGSERVFEILPPGYEWGEHKTASPFLLDLGCRVIEVYAISGPDWEWMPFYSSAEDSMGS
jgi:hypothetical protein